MRNNKEMGHNPDKKTAEHDDGTAGGLEIRRRVIDYSGTFCFEGKLYEPADSSIVKSLKLPLADRRIDVTYDPESREIISARRSKKGSRPFKVIQARPRVIKES